MDLIQQNVFFLFFFFNFPNTTLLTDTLQPEDEESDICENSEEEEEDDDYIPEDCQSLSDTEILGEDEELEKELGDLDQDTTSCTCCSACRQRKIKTGPKPKPFTQVKSTRQRRRRLSKRLADVDGFGEALAIMRRLHREYPESKGDTVTNLSLLTLVRNVRLSYNQVREQ